MNQVGFRIDADLDKKLGDNFNLLGVNGDNHGEKSRELFIELNKKLIIYRDSPEPSEKASEKLAGLETGEMQKPHFSPKARACL